MARRGSEPARGIIGHAALGREYDQPPHPRNARALTPRASSSDRGGRRPPETRPFVPTDPHVGEEAQVYEGIPRES